MRTLRLIIAYDGEPYCGWQIQPNGPTVQQTLAETWKKITQEDVVPDRQRQNRFRRPRASSAGGDLRRAPRFPANDLQRALNAELPHSIRVLEVSEAAADWDPSAMRSENSTAT